MAAPTQVGTAVVIGFGSLAISGYFAEDGATFEKAYGQKEVITDQDGATRTKIRMDKRAVVSGTFLADLGATTEVTVDAATPDEGDTISITDVAGGTTVYEVESASGAMAAGALKINMTLIKEASMTYTV